MDCEKFDRIVLDLLYDEIDELTAAAAKRHMEHCARCRAIGSGLRATREVGMLPLVDAPEGLELRILEGEQRATQLLPIGKRLGRGLSLLAGYAMRPQLAMAALLRLMIGSSLFFLRGRPNNTANSIAMERGVPEGENDALLTAPPAVTPNEPESRAAPAARPDESSRRYRSARNDATGRSLDLGPGAADAHGAGALNSLGASTDDKLAADAARPIVDSDATYDAAMAAYRDGRYSEAERRFNAIAGSGGTHAANAALYEVQALRMVSGCPTAAPRFEAVHSRYPGSVGNDAAWQAADCYRSMGNLALARKNYEQLAADASYKSRAKAAIADLDQIVSNAAVASRRAAASAPPVKAAAPAATIARPKADASPSH